MMEIRHLRLGGVYNMAMEELNIDFSKQTLELCFKQVNYVIPKYQREYVWEEENVKALLDDIIGACNQSFEKQYFVGTIVVYKEKGCYEVIDGQQRLTTFFLLICALKKIHDEFGENSKVLSDLIYSTVSDDMGVDKDSYHLELQYEDATGFLEKIYKDIVTENDIKTGSERKLYDAYNCIYDTLKKEFSKIDDLRKFKGFALKKILFVQIETKDMSEALKIFETINQRGVGLNPMDLLKNLIFMQIKRDKFAELDSKWFNITKTLESIDEQPLRFLRYYIMATYDTSKLKDGIIREDQIYDWITNNNDQCHYEDKPFQFVEQMTEGVKKYAEYLNPLNDSNGNAHLKNITMFAGGKYKLHLLLLLAANKMDVDSLTKFKGVLESVVYYATITRTKTNTLERQFAQWCSQIRSISNLNELDKFINTSISPAVDNWKAEYRMIFMNMGTDTIQQYRIRFILGRIGRYVEVQCQSQGDAASGVGDYIGKGVEIEHIMPQTCSTPNIYGLTSDEYEEKKNKLGNLTLLEKSINASIQNDTYASKCVEYEKSKFYLTNSLHKLKNVGNNTAYTKMNARLSCWSQWSGTSITERQEMLYKLGEEIWAL